MTNLSINQYLGKKTGDTLSAQTWNDVFGAIQTKVNEIVYALNNGGGSGSGDSGNEPEDVGTFVVKGADGSPISIEMHDGVITLPADASYTFEGSLTGRVVIDAKTSKPNDDTFITLNGCTITTANNNCAILYDTPTENQGYQGMTITLARDTQNDIICSQIRQAEGDQAGAIYSTNNLTIQGVGYLAIKNNGGHGIRGTELKIAGPHIYVDALHDAIHGKYIDIDDGVFFFNNCNDCFGVSANGRIVWYSGKIVCYSTSSDGALFDISATGVTAYYANPVGETSTKSPSAVFAEIVTIDETAMETLGFQNIGFACISTAPTSNIGGINNPQLNQSTLSIHVYDAEGGNELTGSSAYTEANGCRTFTSDAKYIVMSGGDPMVNKFLCEDVDVVLRGYCSFVEIERGYENSAQGFAQNNVFDYEEGTQSLRGRMANFWYNYLDQNDESKGRIKITCAKDTINAIIKIDNNGSDVAAAEADAIESDNNIELEMKAGSHLYVSSKLGDGIQGGDVIITDSKGSLIVENCGSRGIRGNAIVIGPNATISKSKISAYITDTSDTKYRTMDGVVVVKDNCLVHSASVGTDTDPSNDADDNYETLGFADIYARNKKYTKGVFGTTNTELRGVLICGTIASVKGIDFGGATHMYYKQALTSGSDAGSWSFTLGTLDPCIALSNNTVYNELGGVASASVPTGREGDNPVEPTT